MKVVTDRHVLSGKEIRYAERDDEGDFHFHSKANFELSEMRECGWDELAALHPAISGLRDRPGTWSAELKSLTGWQFSN